MTDLSQLKIAIFGAGSIGCYVGGQLAHAGVDVTFIGRERFQKALQENGLTLSHFEREDLHIPARQFRFSLSASDISEADIILVCVKSQDTEAAAKDIAKYARPDALVISFQNGVSNTDVLRDSLPITPAFNPIILGAVVPFNVTGKGPGRFHLGTEGDLTIEAHPSQHLIHMQAAFEQAGQGCVFVEDIKAVQWGKLLVNLNNALNTLSGGTLYQGLMQKPYRQALARTLEEALSVLRDAHIEPAQFGKAAPVKMIKVLRLPNFLYRLIMNRLIKIDKTARSSMLDDLEAGRPPEIDYLQGEIVRLAQDRNNTAPINAAIANKITSIFEESNSSPKMSGADILHLVNSAQTG